MDEPTQPTEPAENKQNKARRQRQTMRMVMTWWVIIGGTLMIVFGRNYAVNGIYAPYLGGILIAVGVAAECGVNVWWGGPLDKRLDKAPTN